MRSFSGASLAGAAVLALVSVGCGRVGELQAKKAFKEANGFYQQQDYKKAAELYEETVQAAPDSQAAHQAEFFLGNSYENLFKPSKKGDAANDALLTKAVQHYEKAAETLATSNDPVDKTLGKRAMEYLVSTYGADKLDDPAKAEPVLIKMIQQDPSDPAYYFQLAKLYEDAGVYDAAEQMYVRGRDAKPNDAAGYMQLAGYYNRVGEFDKTIEALEQRASREPNNPEAYYTISTFYWDKAFRDARMKDNEKRALVDKGVQAVDHALQIKPDYAEALVYKGLLLRLEANMEKSPDKQKDLLKQADALRDKANELRKKAASGTD